MKSLNFNRCALCISAAIAMLTGCGGSQPPIGAPASSAASLVRDAASGSGYVQHVVVIIQENRSFENFFAGFPGANAPMYGYAVVRGRRIKVPLRQATFKTNANLPHIWQSAVADWHNGAMDASITCLAASMAPTSTWTGPKLRPIGRWRHSTCSPTRCFQLNSAAATSATSWQSPAMMI